MACLKLALSGLKKYWCNCVFILIAVLLLQNISLGQITRADQLLSRGLALQDSAFYERSNRELQQAAELYEKKGIFIKAAHCYNHLSSNNRLISRENIAEKQAHKALSLLTDPSIKDPTETIRGYTNLGLITATRTNYKESLRWLEKALSLLDNPKVSPVLKMTVIGSLGSLYDDLGKYDKALSNYEKGLDFLQILPDPPKGRLAKIYNNMGVTYTNKGMYRKARQYFKLELSKNIAAKGRAHPDVAGAYLNIGNNYYRGGDVGEALLYFQKAYRSIARKYENDHPIAALSLESMGLCHLKMGNYQKSITYLEEAIAAKKKIWGINHPELAASYINLGQAYEKTGAWQKAYDYFKRALAIQQQSLGRDHPKLAATCNNLSEYYIEIGDYDAALLYLRQARDILLNSVGDHHPVLADTFAMMGKIYATQNNKAQCIFYFQKAMAIVTGSFHNTLPAENIDLQDIEYPPRAISIFYDKARSLYLLYKKTGNLKLLEVSLSTYHSLSDLLDFQQLDCFNETSKLTIGKHSHEIYEKAIETAYELYEKKNDSFYLEEIFYFSEKSKGRVMLEALAKNKSIQFSDIPDSLIQRERQLRNIRTQTRMMLFDTYKRETDTAKLTQLRDSLFILNRKLVKFEQLLQQEYPKYYDLKISRRIPEVQNIQRRLKNEQTTLVEYFYGSTSLWAIIISDKQLRVRPLPYDSLLSQKVLAFKTAIAQQQDSVYKRLGHQLYQELIYPIDRQLPDSNALLIVPDGPLALLQFDALLSKKISPRSSLSFHQLPYLIKTYNIRYSISVTLNEFLEAKQKEHYRIDFAGFAPDFSSPTSSYPSNPERNQKWNPLLFSTIEVQQINSLFQPAPSIWSFLSPQENKSKLYLKQEATETAFKQSVSRNIRFIHLATHAFTSKERQAGVVFSPPQTPKNEDGILFADEIYNLSLASRVIVLSACDTGTGTVMPGEGIMGLSRAFKYAGAQNLLVSLWNVDDRSTYMLMVSFYKHLLENRPLYKALYQAKRKLIGMQRYAHPRFWAPFVLIGN